APTAREFAYSPGARGPRAGQAGHGQPHPGGDLCHAPWTRPRPVAAPPYATATTSPACRSRPCQLRSVCIALVTVAVSAMAPAAAAPGPATPSLAGTWRVSRTCVSGCAGSTDPRYVSTTEPDATHLHQRDGVRPRFSPTFSAAQVSGITAEAPLSTPR